ncbi:MULTISPECIES: Rrf2 family transcriptional regulator [unclassified Microbulbifer]|uniref:Rrf2 family transcriptional regulator n=1 Tax=unclassified Microbulbifer TaxID=2619833 RepID=UPI001E5D40F3|nr:Rrf2 family transcriptional regulator [Microbulbifer sp. YPW16]UHQ55055.1 Rrf2 family transcriptional regulator [Microbulbifer sp. YPW16]
MNITRYTDYSLRILIYLAVHREGLCTISEIADSYGISKNHLMKIVQELNARGYIQAVRGKNGGLRLKQEPVEINIGKLVRETEDESRMVECFGSNNQCVITPACQLKVILGRALESFFATLEEYTLEDLVGGGQGPVLAELLDIKDAARNR